MRPPGQYVVAALAALAVAAAAIPASAEPMFLSRQYTRCAACHVNPSGGGLLSPYGRSLSHVELPIFAAPQPAHDPGTDVPGEEGFLFGALRGALGPVQLGIHLRPSSLHVAFPGGSLTRNFFMAADVIGAWQAGGWTLYGEVGREPEGDGGGTLDSREYWAGRLPESGLGFRVGRFLPAYGVRFADHTSYNRELLDLQQHDQVYGLELSHTSGRYFTQVSMGPGRADAIHADGGDAAFTATGRVQVDMAPSTVLVVSAQYRDATTIETRRGSGGAAFGFAPVPHVTVWTQVDGIFEAGAGSPGVLLVNETSVEVYRGIWLKVSPQLRGGGGEESPDLGRLGLGAVLLPRTHWNVNLMYYRDRDRARDASSQTFLTQVHLFL
jgi:hypothetical protein